MPKNYPLYLIDRQKHLRSADQAFDYVTCFDRTYGFVARVMQLDAEAYERTTEALSHVDNADVMFITSRFATHGGGIVMLVENFLHDFEFSDAARKRIKSLLKRALGKYLHEGVDVGSTSHVDKPTDYSDFWWCENNVVHEGFEAIIKVSPPQAFIKFDSAMAMGADFEEFYKDIAEVAWFGSEPSSAVKRNILYDAWNYLALEERILDNDIDNMDDDDKW